MGRIVMLGDLMLGRSMVEDIQAVGLDSYLEPIRHVVGDSYAVANLECVLTDNGQPREGVVNPLVAPTWMAEEIKKAGIYAVSLANNHIFDCGGQGLLETVKALQRNDIAFFGLEDFCGVGIEGVYVGFVSFTYPAIYNGSLSGVIRSLKRKRKIDFLVVMLHIGVELFQYPLPRDEMIFKVAVDSGADLVVGSHSHCIQASEVYNKKFIYYGLGDLVFDSHVEEVWESFWKGEAHPKKFGIGMPRHVMAKSLIIELEIHDKKTKTLRVHEYDRESRELKLSRPETLWSINDRFMVEKERKRIERELLKSLGG